MTKTSAKASRFMLFAGLAYAGAMQAQSNFFFTPSLSIQALYDDNVLFATDGKTDDYVWRLRPEIDMGYESERFSLQGIYTFDAEYYEDNTDLNDNFIRESAVAEVGYQLSDRMNFSVVGNYENTDTPIVLNVFTGLTPGRVGAQRASVNPVLTHQMTENTEVVWKYNFINDRLDGGVEIDTHSPGFDINRRINERNTLSFFYTYNEYSFDPGGTITSHVPMAGWSHQFNPNTNLTVAAGPRFSEGSVDAEVAIAYRHQLTATGELAFTYDRTQTTTVGELGIAETDRVGGTLTYELGPRSEFLISPYYTSGEQQGVDFEVFQVDVSLDYELNDSVSFISLYQYSFQDGSFGNLIFDNVARNVVMIGVRLSLNRWGR